MAKLRNIGKAIPKRDRAVRNTGAKEDIETLDQLQEFLSYGSVEGDGSNIYEDDPAGDLLLELDTNWDEDEEWDMYLYPI